MPTDRRARLLTRALAILLLYVPAPVVAAYPGLAPWLTADWGGLPASAYLGAAYLLLTMAVTISFSRVAGELAAESEA